MKRRSKHKQYASSLQSVIIPLVLVLMAFLTIGPLAVNSIQTFFYEQKAQDAALLAKSYANSLQTAVDAEYQINKQLQSTLEVAGVTVTKYTGVFTQEILSAMADNLDVDVIYVYDEDTTVTHSNDGTYIGWQAPENHPLRQFHASNLITHTEEIRADSVSKIMYKYGYHRFDDNRIVQVGILAETITTLYKQFSPQHIIEQLSNDSSSIFLAYLDERSTVVASTDGSFIHTPVNYQRAGIPINVNHYSRYKWNDTSYLAFHLPIAIDTVSAGSLLLFYDLTKSDQLVTTLAIIVGTTMLAFFVLFATSLIKTYRKNQRMLFIAFHDELTHLPNLRNFHASVAKMNVTNFACIIVNPLNFKLVNMVYGYEQGDEVLRQIGHLLAALSKRFANLRIYKFSDDRFLLTLYNLKSEKELDQVCDAIRAIKNETKLFNSVELCLGVSISNNQQIDSTKMIQNAAIALNATTAIHPIQYYNKDLEDQLVRKDQIEQDIRSIINGNKDLLRLVYQPIYDTKSKGLVYFEALARMQSPSLGFISPVEFISIAEQRHLIIPLGLQILSLACDFIKTIRLMGYDHIRIAINVSTLQLLDHSFIPTFMEMLEVKDVPIHTIELELTESVFAQDLHIVDTQLKQLRDLGMRLAIDDFGTGYSSLSRLEYLDIDMLKLDKQFVDKLTDRKNKNLAQDIISMAHHINKEVVAEGVETEDQYQYLEKMGCDFIQGYLLCRPLEVFQAISLLEAKDGGTYA